EAGHGLGTRLPSREKSLIVDRKRIYAYAEIAAKTKDQAMSSTSYFQDLIVRVDRFDPLQSLPDPLAMKKNTMKHSRRIPNVIGLLLLVLQLTTKSPATAFDTFFLKPIQL